MGAFVRSDIRNRNSLLKMNSMVIVEVRRQSIPLGPEKLRYELSKPPKFPQVQWNNQLLSPDPI